MRRSGSNLSSMGEGIIPPAETVATRRGSSGSSERREVLRCLAMEGGDYEEEEAILGYLL